MKLVASAINKLPPHVGEVFRGTAAKYLDAYQKNATVVESAFVSTSARGGVPEDFRSDGAMTITSKRCAMIAMLSDKPFEGEVLCAPGSQFKVVSRKTEDGVTTVVVTQL